MDERAVNLISTQVDGEKRIAIVAQRPIAADEEVTFDYSWKGMIAASLAFPALRVDGTGRHRRVPRAA